MSAPDIVELWPGYTEQSWSERFAELARQSKQSRERLIRYVQIQFDTKQQIEALQRKLDVAEAALSRVDVEIQANPHGISTSAYGEVCGALLFIRGETA